MKSVFTEEYEFLLEYLISARKSAKITQQELAKRLRKPQSFISKYERRERRLDVVEFVSLAQSIGFDPCGVLREIEKRLQRRPKRKEVGK